MSGGEPKIACTVRDGKFVEPCDALGQLIDTYQPGFSRKRGVFQTTYMSITTHQPSRSFVGIKCDVYKNGLLFNFCPVCGSDISAPFMTDDVPAASQPVPQAEAQHPARVEAVAGDEGETR